MIAWDLLQIIYLKFTVTCLLKGIFGSYLGPSEAMWNNTLEDGTIPLAFQDALKPCYNFAKSRFLFLSSQFQNKFFNLFQMLVIFSDMIIYIKTTYDVILYEYRHLAEDTHTSIWESDVAQDQQRSLLKESHVESGGCYQNLPSYCSRRLLKRENTILVAWFFSFIVGCAKMKSLISSNFWKLVIGLLLMSEDCSKASLRDICACRLILLKIYWEKEMDFQHSPLGLKILITVVNLKELTQYRRILRSSGVGQPLSFDQVFGFFLTALFSCDLFYLPQDISNLLIQRGIQPQWLWLQEKRTWAPEWWGNMAAFTDQKKAKIMCPILWGGGGHICN